MLDRTLCLSVMRLVKRGFFSSNLRDDLDTIRQQYPADYPVIVEAWEIVRNELFADVRALSVGMTGIGQADRSEIAEWVTQLVREHPDWANAVRRFAQERPFFNRAKRLAALAQRFGELEGVQRQQVDRVYRALRTDGRLRQCAHCFSEELDLANFPQDMNFSQDVVTCLLLPGGPEYREVIRALWDLLWKLVAADGRC